MTDELKQVPQGRVVSIDALRGFDMFWIIGGDFFIVKLADMVDAPWGEFLRTQVEHTAWHGFTFLDLIFPLFLFIVGLSMTYSMGKRIARDGSWTNRASERWNEGSPVLATCFAMLSLQETLKK